MQKELGNYITMIKLYEEGQFYQKTLAIQLGLSERQICRILKRYKEEGILGL